ncbi:MAG: NAD(P)-binding domain-containing protein, partial [Rhodospirillales bacterium]|nr:NAD(P)-binding domain-containing protein [Rhodospirillales bacterium]
MTDNLDIRRNPARTPAAAQHQPAKNKKRPTLRRDREQTMAAETIGFVGIGRMGGPMAGRLMDAGYSLCIYDPHSEATKALVARGARLAKSPAEVASSADIVLASLPTPDIVKAVALGPDGIVAGNRA